MPRRSSESSKKAVRDGLRASFFCLRKISQNEKAHQRAGGLFPMARARGVWNTRTYQNHACRVRSCDIKNSRGDKGNGEGRKMGCPRPPRENPLKIFPGGKPFPAFPHSFTHGISE